MLARHDASGTLVAIKYLHRDLLADAEFAGMFRGEATVLASVTDQNIVALYEYVESPSGAAIVMELVAGVSLREILTFQGKTTPEAALTVLRGSLLGLAAAHRRGVVHRDYKPENVLVNGDGISKLTDFGIAARTGDQPVPAGTLLYAAPEQMAGAQASPASDIYAATATFFECLTGRPPFHGGAVDLLRQHDSEPVPVEQVPERLRPLVAAGMAKDPRNRPTDATTFVNELQVIASGAYGKAWNDRGRSHLGEAALLLAALWPSGAPPSVLGSSEYQVPLRGRMKLARVSPLKMAIAAGLAVTAAAAGTALAARGSSRQPIASGRPAAVVQSISLQPSPAPFSPSVSSPSQSPPSQPPSSPAQSPSPDSVSSPPPLSQSPSSEPQSTQVQTGSTDVPAQVPQITSVGTYTQGVLVYFDIQYADPGNDAEGFGFVGVNGSGWAEEDHPFTSPSYGIVGTDSIAYPFNEGCGTAQQSQSDVQAWIYDTAGDRSEPVTIHLACS
jgi:serine/threonine-protein kinase